MHFTPRINDALRLASRLHRDQVRKDSDHTPYISHLVAVAMLLREVTDDEDVIIAGLMHDSLEDVPNYSYDDLVRDCGERVAAIVKHVTEPLDANKLENEQLPWLVRKEAYLDNLRSGGVESALVSTADKIHNTESFIEDIKKDGESFSNRFHSSFKNKVWFNEKVLEIVVERLGSDHILVRRFIASTERFKELAILA